MTRLKNLFCWLAIAVVLVACSTAQATSTAAPSAAATAPSPTRNSATASAAPSPAAQSTPTHGATTVAAGTPGRAPSTPNLPNTTPEAGAALIEQAVNYLLEYYVDPLDSGDLYRAAYEGTTAALTSFGKVPQAPPLALAADPKQNATAFKTAYLALVGANGPEINQTALAYEAIRAVTAKIDECHTAFLSPEQLQSVTAGLSGTNTYGGIGVTIRTQSRPVTIGGIFPNTPAARSGLRPGDAIVAVDGVDVADLPADAISPLVRGQEGTPVRVTVRRPGQAAPLDFTIVRAQIQVPVFISEVRTGPNGEKIGYMKLYSFSTDSDQQLRQALEAFEREGVVAWVLDLRDNGGGYIDVLSRITSNFVQGKPVAYRIVRGGGGEEIATNPSGYFATQHPFAILINGGSASASEALASSAADHGFARLFGQTTAGCLAGATNYKLADGSAVQITIWKIVSPERREINRLGQPPAEEIAPDPTGATDPVLERAIAWLVAQR